MPSIGTIVQQLKVGGVSASKTTPLTAAYQPSREIVVAGAKTGTLSLRTDVDTGELTLAAGHGIATADKISIFWSTGGGGARRNVTVGTVAGNVVPIDLGSGDNLPALNDPVTVMKETTKDFNAIGANLVALVATVGLNVRANVAILDGSNAELFFIPLNPANKGQYLWPGVAGEANPLAGVTAAKVRVAHGSVTTQTIKVAAGES